MSRCPMSACTRIKLGFMKRFEVEVDGHEHTSGIGQEPTSAQMIPLLAPQGSSLYLFK